MPVQRIGTHLLVQHVNTKIILVDPSLAVDCNTTHAFALQVDYSFKIGNRIDQVFIKFISFVSAFLPVAQISVSTSDNYLINLCNMIASYISTNLNVKALNYWTEGKVTYQEFRLRIIGKYACRRSILLVLLHRWR